MKNWFLFILFGIPFMLMGQDDKIVRIEGTAQVDFPDSKSRLQVESEVTELATVNALEQAFGRAVIQGNSTYLKNMTTGKEVETSTTFNMIANTMVKGEVLEVLDRKYEEVKGIKSIDGKKVEIRDLKCTVRIKARELSESVLEFESYPLACTDPKCRTTDFKNNDPLYLFFKSPASGYLTVFLDDEKQCQCLLPYLGMAGKFEDGVPVKADQEYILFSTEKDKSYFTDASKADEYVMTAESIQDQNRLFIIFSTTPIPKPGLTKDSGTGELSEAEQQAGWKLPKALSSEEFQKWLIKNRIHNRNILVKVVDITITK
ncbi:MAG: DUF4384 domain-containing protein [Bacteroidales bacterium]|jgi:hypothetical protein|nr:DUF4384 domain-containing protein [Bacteroidales bacterium]